MNNTKYLIIFMSLIIAGFIAKDTKGEVGEWVRSVEQSAVRTFRADRTVRNKYKAKVDQLSFWEGKDYRQVSRRKFIARGFKGNMKAIGCRIKIGANICDRAIDAAWYMDGDL